MAGNFTLNPAIPGLSQVLIALGDGTVYDYKKATAGGAGVVTDPKKQTVIRSLRIGGVLVHVET